MSGEIFYLTEGGDPITIENGSFLIDEQLSDIVPGANGYTVQGFSEVLRNEQFAFYIKVYFNDDAAQDLVPVEEFVLEPAGPQYTDAGVTIQANAIFGAYNEIFSDGGSYKYVSLGSSDRIETPTTVTTRSEIPPNQDLFEFIEPATEKAEAAYNIFSPNTNPREFLTSFSHDIRNTFDGDSYLTNYFANRSS